MNLLRGISITAGLMNTLVMPLLLIIPRIDTKKYFILSLALIGPLTFAHGIGLFIFGLEAVSKWIILTLTVPTLIYFFVISKHRDGRVIFAFCFGDMLNLWLGTLGSICYYLSGNNLWVMLISRLILFIAADLLIFKYLRTFYLTIADENKKGWWLIGMVSFMFYAMLMVLTAVPSPILERPNDMPVYIFFIILMVFSYIVIFRTMANQHTILHYERISRFMLQQTKALENTVKSMEQNDKKLLTIKHDLRHYENGLRNLVKSGDMDAILKYIGQTADILKSDEPVNYCDSTSLNSILNFYINNAKEEGCSVQTRFQLAHPIPVNDIELCVVFANALENAINACKQIDDISKRKIKITCVDNPQFAFEITNTYTGEVQFDENNIPVSKDAEHGYGTQSILAFAEKHSAVLDYDTDEEWFKVRMVLPS